MVIHDRAPLAPRPGPRDLLGDLLDTLSPARCPGCGRRAVVVFCDRCAATVAPASNASPPPPLAWWTARFAYEGAVRELVARAKYRNERRFVAAVAGEVASAVARAPVQFDVITWAPASAARLRAQGVDHGEWLARAVGRALGTRVTRALARLPGAPQTGLDAPRRRAGPPLRATGGVAGRTVLVVDDVATTGGTLAAAARALLQVGALEVVAATIARTPRPGPRPPGRPGPPAYTPPGSDR